MLHRNYLDEAIENFTVEINKHLPLAMQGGNQEEIDLTEKSVARLLELDPSYALGLAPQSLVMMLQLNGVGYLLASYACYALHKISMAYAAKGDLGKADLREAQALALAEAFDYDLKDIPQGIEEVN